MCADFRAFTNQILVHPVIYGLAGKTGLSRAFRDSGNNAASVQKRRYSVKLIHLSWFLQHARAFTKSAEETTPKLLYEPIYTFIVSNDQQAGQAQAPLRH